MERYQISAATFNKLAKQYQDKYMALPLYTPTYDLLCERLAEDAKVLDIGCGPGNIARYLLHRRPRLDYFGIDLAPNMVALARANNPSANFSVMNCLDIGTLSEHYDVIVCGFCLPYLTQPQVVALLNAISNRLKTGGILYLSTMEGDYVNSAMQTSSSGDKAFIHYHDGVELMAMLESHGIKAEYVHRQDYPDRGDVDLFIIATYT